MGDTVNPFMVEFVTKEDNKYSYNTQGDVTFQVRSHLLKCDQIRPTGFRHLHYWCWISSEDGDFILSCCSLVEMKVS